MEKPWRPKVNPWIVAMTVTLATFMEVLDSSIANVSLPHIAGGLGATQEEATWVLTAYLVANAIILPAGAYMTTFIGRKKFYMICVALFGISSALCGLAPTLPLLVFFRVLQGIGGGGLAPSEQAILADTFPPAKRGQAFAMYGLAVVCAPAIGPTLGGYITDNFNWRWIFFLNVPICLLSLFLTSRIVEDPPWVAKEVKANKRGGIKLDMAGFALVAMTFGSLEFILDKGQEDDWFSSHLITFFVGLMVVAFITLIWWELKQLQSREETAAQPDAVQAKTICHQLLADVCAGIFSLCNDHPDSSVCADAAWLYGGAGRAGTESCRVDDDVHDADCGLPERQGGPTQADWLWVSDADLVAVVDG